MNELEDKIKIVLRNIYDPEIPVSIYELGLIYEINISSENDVVILMTLTSPNCPVAESLPNQVKTEIGFLKEVNNVSIELTFEPPWSDDMMSEEAKLELGLL